MLNKPCPDCGSMIGLTATRCRCGWQERGKQADGRASGACTAYGCPLPGTATRGPGGDMFCSIHAAHVDLDLQAITKGIRKRIELFAAVGRMGALSQVDWWMGKCDFDQFYELGAPELVATDKERRGLAAGWYSRALRTLDDAILADMGIHRGNTAPIKPAYQLGPKARPGHDPEHIAARIAFEEEVDRRDAERRARTALDQMRVQLGDGGGYDVLTDGDS